jgi:hypothetical protein
MLADASALLGLEKRKSLPRLIQLVGGEKKGSD